MMHNAEKVERSIRSFSREMRNNVAFDHFRVFGMNLAVIFDELAIIFFKIGIQANEGQICQSSDSLPGFFPDYLRGKYARSAPRRAIAHFIGSNLYSKCIVVWTIALDLCAFVELDFAPAIHVMIPW